MAQTDDLKKWAGDLARNTQDVVAVANRMEVLEPSVWDFSPAWGGLLVLWRDFIRSLPFVFFSRHEELAAVSTKAEAGLYSEAVVIEEQARQTQLLKGDEVSSEHSVMSFLPS